MKKYNKDLMATLILASIILTTWLIGRIFSTANEEQILFIAKSIAIGIVSLIIIAIWKFIRSVID